MTMEKMVSEIKKWLMTHKTLVAKAALGFLILVIALSIYVQRNKEEDKMEITLPEEIIEMQPMEEDAEEQGALETEEMKEEIFVDIGGAVNSPGVVKLPADSRVIDAVSLAGGLSEQAETMNVNLAAKLMDGDKVYIPFVELAGNAHPPTQNAGIITDSVQGQGEETSGNQTINLNKATSEELQTLSGVGPATAEKIIAHRENVGGFKKIEELMDVSGIGEKTFLKLKAKIIV